MLKRLESDLVLHSDWAIFPKNFIVGDYILYVCLCAQDGIKSSSLITTNLGAMVEFLAV